VVFTIPSANGMTLGTTAGTDYTRLSFWLSSGATQSVNAGNPGVQTYSLALWGVQLEIAQPGQTVPTKLEKRDPVLELQQCQRFYCTGTVGWYGNGTAGNNVGSVVSFSTPMRAVPTIIISGAVYGNSSGASSAFPGVSGFLPFVVVTASAAVNYTANYTASADL
jgi:hypothetical protein